MLYALCDPTYTGMSDGFKRMVTGQNFFISDYRYEGPENTTGTVALGTDFPSKIIRLSPDEYGGKLVCQKGALLCASHTIDIDMEFTKNFSSGFFGGEVSLFGSTSTDGTLSTVFSDDFLFDVQSSDHRRVSSFKAWLEKATSFSRQEEL